MRRTIADRKPDGGTVRVDGASASWVYEAGIVHVYDVAIERAGALAPVLAAIDMAARERGAAVLSATLWEDAPETPELLGCGFERDWDERDVRDGVVALQIGYVRAVG
jgi:hypothetical protein